MAVSSLILPFPEVVPLIPDEVPYIPPVAPDDALEWMFPVAPPFVNELPDLATDTEIYYYPPDGTLYSYVDLVTFLLGHDFSESDIFENTQTGVTCTLQQIIDGEEPQIEEVGGESLDTAVGVIRGGNIFNVLPLDVEG
ncbi:MAG: hypothetical protein K0T99_02140 [Alphaproteobacteria bacterium]|nr:hypothetical protein [Alphaproteobacteria bacterium]